MANGMETRRKTTNSVIGLFTNFGQVLTLDVVMETTYHKVLLTLRVQTLN